MNDQLTAKEREDYGDDFLNVVAKQARAATSANTHAMQQSLAEVQQALRKVKLDEMKKALDARLPEWRMQNTNPGFLQWLSERDQYSGMTRQQLLSQAWAGGDAERVLNIFQGYRSQSGQQRQGSQVSPSTGSAPGSLWALGTRGAITTKQIENFHKWAIEGRFTPQEKAQRDREMVEAGREGRII